tara:strand:- start:201 stop:443 length:243 start_codon:yes stop_codon:yes gene_type:complete
MEVRIMAKYIFTKKRRLALKKAQRARKKQGYNARKDEQLGMTRGKQSSKKMSAKGRRKVARATRKPKGSFGFTHKRGKKK